MLSRALSFFITIPPDIAVSIMEKEEESKKRLSELEINHDKMSVALYIDTFGMKGVIVTDENNKMMLLCYPTGTTERRLKALNEAIEEKKDLLGMHNLTYPITIGSLTTNKKDIYDMIYDTNILGEYKRNRIFDDVD